MTHISTEEITCSICGKSCERRLDANKPRCIECHNKLVSEVFHIDPIDSEEINLRLEKHINEIDIRSIFDNNCIGKKVYRIIFNTCFNGIYLDIIYKEYSIYREGIQHNFERFTYGRASYGAIFHLTENEIEIVRNNPKFKSALALLRDVNQNT